MEEDESEEFEMSDNLDSVSDSASPFTSRLSLCRSSSSPIPASKLASNGRPTAAATTREALTSQAKSLEEEEERQMPSFEPMNLEDNLRLNAKTQEAINERLIATFDEDEIEDEDDDDDNDVVEVKNEVDSAASVSPDSNHFSTKGSLRKKGSDVDSLDEDEDRLAALRLDQDAISDESGYSEESSSKTTMTLANHHSNNILSGKTTLVTLNSTLPKNKGEGDAKPPLPVKPDFLFQSSTTSSKIVAGDDGQDERDNVNKSNNVDDLVEDLTVQSFGGGRPQMAHSSNNRVAEFCINIWTTQRGIFLHIFDAKSCDIIHVERNGMEKKISFVREFSVAGLEKSTHWTKSSSMKNARIFCLAFKKTRIYLQQ